MCIRDRRQGLRRRTRGEHRRTHVVQPDEERECADRLGASRHQGRRGRGRYVSDNNEILEDPVGAVVTACRVLGDNDLGDMVWGHVSVRDPDGRGIWMKPHMYGFEEIEREQVLLVTFDGDVLEGKGRRHGEYPIHTEIMRARPCLLYTSRCV